MFGVYFHGLPGRPWDGGRPEKDTLLFQGIAKTEKNGWVLPLRLMMTSRDLLFHF